MGHKSHPSARADRLAEETSLHGIPRMIDSFRDRDYVSVVFWTVLFVAATVLCAYMLSSRFKYYLSDPKATNIELIVPATLELPSITICNRSPVDLRRFKAWVGQGKPHSSEFCWNSALRRCDRDCDEGLVRDCAGFCVPLVNLTASSRILNCKGDCVGVELLGNNQCDDDFNCNAFFFDFGQCEQDFFLIEESIEYLERSGGDPGLLSALSFSIDDVLLLEKCLLGEAGIHCTTADFITTNLGIAIGNCFTLVPSVVQVASGVGGVILELATVREGQMPVFLGETYETLGFYLIIHERGTAPSIQNAIPIGAGVENFVQLTQTVLRDKTSNSNCRDDPSYSDRACVEECFDEELNRLCGTEDDVLTCLGNKESEIMAICNNNQRCPPKCSFTAYSTSMSQTRWPTGFVRDSALVFVQEVSLCADLADCEGFLDSVVRVQIFFGELSYREVTKKDTYPLSALVSEIGGTTGLFLGCGMLTAAELLMFVVYKAWGRWHNRAVKAQPELHVQDTVIELAKVDQPAVAEEARPAPIGE